jgi:hypothetical protein
MHNFCTIQKIPSSNALNLEKINRISTVKFLEMYIYFELPVPCTLAYLIGNTSGGIATMNLSNLVVSTVSWYCSCSCIII